MTQHLNSDHLRTFLAIHEAGSVTGGAALIGRSQSATSLQIRQLEDTVGKPLFHRHGRGVSLTASGETLYPVARRVVRSLDATLAELRGGGLKGKLRIGMPDDHSRSDLANIVADFAVRHPDVELEVNCALGVGFATALQSGALDLAVHEVAEPDANQRILRESSLVWMCGQHRDFTESDVLPIAVFERDCWWRDLAVSSLEEVGRPHQIIFTSESTIGVRAAAKAGFAAALLDADEDTDGLRRMPELPNRYPSYLVLQKAQDAKGPIAEAMCDAVLRAFAV